LHQAHLEPGEQRRHRRRRRAPALKRALRHPPVDDDHRDAPLGSREDEVGPEIGFDEQREARLPVIEEARHEARRVVGDELVNDIGRKAFRNDRGRGYRARRQKNADVHRTHPLDQPRHRKHFADACAVHPHQGSRRPLGGAKPLAFADPRLVLLAVLQPMLDQRAGKRRRHRRQ